MLEARAHPVDGIASVEDEQCIRVLAVQFAEVPAALDERSVVAVAFAPGGSRDANHVHVCSPVVHAVQQWSTRSEVVMQGQGERVPAPVHRADAVGLEIGMERRRATLVEPDHEDAAVGRFGHQSLQRSSLQRAR